MIREVYLGKNVRLITLTAALLIAAAWLAAVSLSSADAQRQILIATLQLTGAHEIELDDLRIGKGTIGAKKLSFGYGQHNSSIHISLYDFNGRINLSSLSDILSILRIIRSESSQSNTPVLLQNVLSYALATPLRDAGASRLIVQHNSIPVFSGPFSLQNQILTLGAGSTVQLAPTGETLPLTFTLTDPLVVTAQKNPEQIEISPARISLPALGKALSGDLSIGLSKGVLSLSHAALTRTGLLLKARAEIQAELVSGFRRETLPLFLEISQLETATTVTVSDSTSTSEPHLSITIEADLSGLPLDLHVRSTGVPVTESPLLVALQRLLLPTQLSITAGGLTGEAFIRVSSPDEFVLTTPVPFVFKGLSGLYEGRQLTDASLSLNCTAQPGKWSVETRFSAEKLDPGIPLTEISAEADLSSGSAQSLSLNLKRATFTILGGAASLTPLSTSLSPPSGSGTLRVDGVDLAEVFALYPGGSLSGTGTVDLMVPFSFGTGFVLVKDAFITGRPEGGTLNYSLATGAAPSNPQLALAAQALRNLRFSHLSARANSDHSGTAVIQASLRGSSATMNRKQPIHVNLTIEENVPKLFESLRIGKNISDNLEQRFAPK